VKGSQTQADQPGIIVILERNFFMLYHSARLGEATPSATTSTHRYSKRRRPNRCKARRLMRRSMSTVQREEIAGRPPMDETPELALFGSSTHKPKTPPVRNLQPQAAPHQQCRGMSVSQLHALTWA